MGGLDKCWTRLARVAGWWDHRPISISDLAFHPARHQGGSSTTGSCSGRTAGMRLATGWAIGPGKAAGLDLLRIGGASGTRYLLKCESISSRLSSIMFRHSCIIAA